MLLNTTLELLQGAGQRNGLQQSANGVNVAAPSEFGTDDTDLE
jgi:hypothetical protein